VLNWNWSLQKAARRREWIVEFNLPWSRQDNIANTGRLLAALVWTFAWGTARWVWYSIPCGGMHAGRGLRRRRDAFSWGRRDSPKAVWCPCGWVGPLRWMIHTYGPDGCGDVEPVDECPRCGGWDLHQPVLMRKDGVWSS